uniref:Uncharacterized protein n=1 Tax=Pelodiscus sinensis TaxID=13735 RepID=K7GHT7_PELSI
FSARGKGLSCNRGARSVARVGDFWEVLSWLRASVAPLALVQRWESTFADVCDRGGQVIVMTLGDHLAFLSQRGG